MKVFNFKQFEASNGRELIQKGFMPITDGIHGQIWFNGKDTYYYDGLEINIENALDKVKYWLEHVHGFENSPQNPGALENIPFSDYEDAYIFVNEDGWILFKENPMTGEQDQLQLLDVIWRMEKGLDPFY